jgi:pimeloyl-ACP methyl ester carboxylesterase
MADYIFDNARLRRNPSSATTMHQCRAQSMKKHSVGQAGKPSALSRRRMLIGLSASALGISAFGRGIDGAGYGIVEREYDGSPDCYLFVPPNRQPASPLLVTVHGISRNARELVSALAGRAEQLGVVIMAPVFGDYRYGDYQRLGRRGRGARADKALQKLIRQVIAELKLISSRFYLYGHSGGAQFAHRYAMAYPREVAALGLSAAGWYTLPDPDLPYPYGIRPTSDAYGLTLDPKEFLRVPACVFIGDGDVSRDGSFNRSDNVDAVQGRNRKERAAHWVASMTEAARVLGYGTHYSLHVLLGADHDFDELVEAGLVGDLFDCLFGSGIAPAALEL